MAVGNATRVWTYPRGLLANLRTLRRARRRGGCATGCGRERTDDARLPWDADGDYGGWGGHAHHGTDPGVRRSPVASRSAGTANLGASERRERAPVLFVHGNQRDACDWEPHARFFLERGYGGDELWAITFAEGSPDHPAMAEQLEAFVDRVLAETGAETVSVVAHSLGVTGARFWLDARDRYDRVDAFVGLAGANHGTVLSSLCADVGLTRGTYKVSPFLRADYGPDHPLARLNEDETPGDVDYYTIRGTEDPLFWGCRESPALEGATNVVLETDHDGVRDDVAALRHVYRWLSGNDPYDLSVQVNPER